MPPIDDLADLAIPEPDESRQGWLVEQDLASSAAGLLREVVLCAHRAFGRHMAALELPAIYAQNAAPDPEGRSIALLHRLNGRRRFSADLQADALAMAQARQAEPLVGQTLTGVISGVQSYGFFVEVPPSQVEGLVHVSSLKDDWYEYRSRQNRLVGRKNRRSYMLGDAVEVIIQKVDVLRHQIDLAVVLPEGVEEMDPETARRASRDDDHDDSTSED